MSPYNVRQTGLHVAAVISSGLNQSKIVKCAVCLVCILFFIYFIFRPFLDEVRNLY